MKSEHYYYTDLETSSVSVEVAVKFETEIIGDKSEIRLIQVMYDDHDVTDALSEEQKKIYLDEAEEDLIDQAVRAEEFSKERL